MFHIKHYRGEPLSLDNAACNGHLEVVRFLHEQGYPHTEGALNRAAADGHLEVVRFLHQQGYPRAEVRNQEWAHRNSGDSESRSKNPERSVQASDFWDLMHSPF